VRQPIECIANSCVELLLETIKHYSTESQSRDTADVVIVDNELIVRGSTMSRSDEGDESLDYTKEEIARSLELSLAGLILPAGVTLTDIIDAYWDSVTSGSNQLLEYIERHLDSSIKYEDIHWWSNLSHHLEYHTQNLLKHQENKQYSQSVLTILAGVRERAWSVSLDHEFDAHRSEILQNKMQLQMSSCTKFAEILHVLSDWLETLDVKRSFLVKFTMPGSQPSEQAELVHVYREGEVADEHFDSFKAIDLLPEPLQDELEQQKTNLESANSELFTLAQYDALTGLPNRHHFQNQLTSQCLQASGEQSSFALLFIDLDGFKHINDTLGHDAGDKLLESVARRLESLFKPSQQQSVFIARLGGDEFTIIIEKAAHREQVSSVIREVLSEICKPFMIDKQNLTVTGSVGCAFYPSNGEDVETLVKHADTAMYHAKGLRH